MQQTQNRGDVLRSVLPYLAARVIIAAGCLASWGALSAEEPPREIVDRPSSRELEKPSYLPPQPAEEFQLPPVEERELSPGVRGQTLAVKGFVFEGNKAIPSDDLQRVAAPFAARNISSAELEELRQNLSRYYIERGYINSGALLNPGFYQDGTVHFRIVEGRVENVRFTGMGRLRESYVRDRLIRPDEPLDVNVLQERFQLLLTDPLFAKVNARLQPGTGPGRATLDVEVTRARPYNLSIFADNYRSPSIGAEALGLAGRVRNLTGLGDVVDATVQGGRERNERVSLRWAVPIIDIRTLMQARYDHGRSSVLEEPLDALDIKSVLDSREIGISRTLVKTIRRQFSLGITYTHRENATELLGEPFSFVPGEPTGTSKVSAWRFDQEFVQRWEKQVLALRSIFTSGRTNTIATEGNPNITPQKHYFFWIGQTQFTRRVMDNGSDVLLRANVQWSQDRLVPLERFAIGGVTTVRGYRENQLVRDQGFNATVEFRYPLLDRPAAPHRLILIPFVDYGEAWNKGEKRDALAAIGLGLNYQFRGFSAELYVAKRLIEPEAETSGDLQDHGVHFQLRYDL
ncbi:MAG: ShlB/FhaC/HecB family hemolysin secretion/activation protein [Burkholderiales bacterium]